VSQSGSVPLSVSLIHTSYKEYREQQEALHAAWAERQKEREAKIARGEKVGPPEPDPTAQKEVGFIGLLKFIIFSILFLALAGKFITGSYTWEYDAKWLQVKKLFQPVMNFPFVPQLVSTHLL
jgi:hypothetical protein